MIHIANGDAVGQKLLTLYKDVLVWREMYDYGPLATDISGEAWMRRRAGYFEEKIGVPAALFLENGNQQHAALDKLPQDAEIMLWFEHDRYDQVMLIYLLCELSRRGLSRLSMVSIDRYPGIEPFRGLGQLSAAQLDELYERERQPISAEQIQEAAAAWAAYTAENPRRLEEWIGSTSRRLPYLKQAMKSHLSYFPSVRTGLNEVQELSVRYLKDGPCTFAELFRTITNERPNDGLSDLHFAALLGDLMEGEQPLILCDGSLPTYHSPGPDCWLTLSIFGREVIEQRRDRFDFVGIHWWLGGIFLGRDEWRWDGEKLVNDGEISNCQKV